MKTIKKKNKSNKENKTLEKKKDKKKNKKSKVIQKKNKSKKKNKETKKHNTPIKKTEEPKVEDSSKVSNLQISDVFSTFNRLIHLLDQLSTKPLIYNGNGIFRSELKALERINELEPVTLTELAADIGVTKSAMLKTTNKLIHKDLINKAKSSTNKREVQITLSEEGRKICEQAPIWFEKQNQPVMDALERMSPEELAFFNAALERIMMNLIIN